MALATGSLATAADYNTVLTAVNNTLQTYGLGGLSTTYVGATILASQINDMVTGLKSADASSANRQPNVEQSTLTTAQVSVGQLIRATSLVTLNSCATNILNRYCGCNSHCSCNNCYCSCDDCYCSCNSNCYSWTCSIGSEYTCFMPDTIIISAAGPKKVQNIKVGDFILTADGTFDEVLSAYSVEAKDQKIITYKGDSFEVSLTNTHMIPIDAQNNIMYPILADVDEPILFKANVPYPKEFLKKLVYFGASLISADNYSATFTYSKELVDICKTLILSGFNMIKQDNTVTIFGRFNDFEFSQFIKCCIQDNGKIIYPSFIYRLPKDVIEQIKKDVDNGLEFQNIEQCIQIKLLLNCHGYDYKRVHNKLVFIKNCENNKNFAEITDSIYNGLVYNVVCKNKHFIASEILVGDGYV